MKTHFAPPERSERDSLIKVSERLKSEILLPWFDALPLSIIVINSTRQIVFCNEAFRRLSNKKDREELISLRPGEALGCIHSELEEAGCGCSTFCEVCGAAKAILKSLNGNQDCQNCRMLRYIDEVETPLDLQVYTQPIDFQGETFTLFSAVDISHELRLKYLERTFLHGLINSAGGINLLSGFLNDGEDDPETKELLASSSERILRDVFYHRDVIAAEIGKLSVKLERIDLQEFLERLVHQECEIRNVQMDSVIEMRDCGLEVISDKRILSHVVRNMLVNALEALKPTVGKVEVSCRANESGAVEILVSNPGTIPEHIQKQLFKRYVSTKGESRGLGTYVMKTLSRQYLNSDVNFSSSEGSTVFTLTLGNECS